MKKLLTCFLLLSAWTQAQTAVTLNGHSYNLRSHPRVLLDGCHWLGAWSSSTAYNAFDGVSRLGVNYHAVKASTNQQPPNATYWVVDPACNASNPGVLTSAMMAGTRANTNNPAYQGMLTAHSNFIGSAHGGNGQGACGASSPEDPNGYQCRNSMFGQTFYNGGKQGGSQQGTEFVNASLLWLANGADPSDTNYLPVAIWLAQHIEDWIGGALGCDTTTSTCSGRGSNDMDIHRIWLPQLGQAYSIIHDQLSTGDRQHFAAAILNDATEAQGGEDSVACTIQTHYIGAVVVSVAASPTGATESANTVTITTTAKHKLHIGDTVVLLDVGVAGYNGTYTVATIPTTTTFTYTNGTAGLAASGGGVVQTVAGHAPAVGEVNITAGSVTLAGTNTTFTGLAVGGAILVSGNSTIYRISSIQSDTSLTLSKPAEATVTDGQYNYEPASTRPWQYCGLLHFFKWGADQNPAPLGDVTTAYTSPSGKSTATWNATYNTSNGASYTQNLFLTGVPGFLSLAIALADDDPRAALLVQQAFDHYYNIMLPFIRSTSTGFNQGSCAYGPGRHMSFHGELATMMQNSVINGPDLVGSAPNYLSQVMPYYLYTLTPDWGKGFWAALDAWGDTGNCQTTTFIWGLLADQYLFPSTNDTKYVRDLIRNRIGQYSAGQTYWGNTGDGISAGRYAGFNYIFYDPNAACTSIDGASVTPAAGTPACASGPGTAAPLQHVFRSTDCSTAYSGTDASGFSRAPSETNAGCSNFPSKAYHYAVSKTDWTSTATHVMLQSATNNDRSDHSGSGEAPAFDIYRNGWLLASGDGNTTGTDAVNNYRDNANTVQLGGTAANQGKSEAVGLLVGVTGSMAYAQITRWAGDSITGDSLNRYVYAMSDLNPSGTLGWYCKALPCQSFLGTVGKVMGVTIAQRHLLHLKESGLQDYVVAYDDFEMANSGYMKAFWHYDYNQGANTVTPCSTLGCNTMSVVTPLSKLNATYLTVAGASTVALVTDTTLSPGATLCPLTGPPTQGQPCAGPDYVADTGNPYPNPGKHVTWRVLTCASTDASTCDHGATNFEEVFVAQPLNATTGSMPTIAQPSCTGSAGTTCTVVEIQDASAPKVAAFVRHGALATSLNFITSHSGTAQYVLTGLGPATYNVTKNGVVVSGSPFTVAAGDTSLTFDSASGTINATQTPPDSTPPTCAMTSPSAGTISGSVTLSATASDNIGVARVDFKYGSTLIVSDTTAPYSQLWDTTTVTNGTYTVTCTAFDAAGNSFQDAGVSVTINNGGGAPSSGLTIQGNGTQSGSAVEQ